jgi:hypothetical protein
MDQTTNSIDIINIQNARISAKLDVVDLLLPQNRFETAFDWPRSQRPFPA